MQYYTVSYITDYKKYLTLPLQIIPENVQLVFVSSKDEFSFEEGLALIEGHQRKPVLIDQNLPDNQLDLFFEKVFKKYSTTQIISKDRNLLEFFITKVKQILYKSRESEKFRGKSVDMVIVDELL